MNIVSLNIFKNELNKIFACLNFEETNSKPMEAGNTYNDFYSNNFLTFNKIIKNNIKQLEIKLKKLQITY